MHASVSLTNISPSPPCYAINKTGYAPFESEDEQELLDLICNAEFEFHEDYWNDIEDPSKQLISQLLEPNPKKRLTARQALRSPWLRRRDRDWVKEMDDSSSTFDRWLERRNNTSFHGTSMNGSGHMSTGSLGENNSNTISDNIDNDNTNNSGSNRSLGTWEMGGDSGHNQDIEDRSCSSEPFSPSGRMQDSSSANMFSEADSSAE